MFVTVRSVGDAVPHSLDKLLRPVAEIPARWKLPTTKSERVAVGDWEERFPPGS